MGQGLTHLSSLPLSCGWMRQYQAVTSNPVAGSWPMFKLARLDSCHALGLSWRFAAFPRLLGYFSLGLGVSARLYLLCSRVDGCKARGANRHRLYRRADPQGRCRRPCGSALYRGRGSTVSFPAQFCGLQQGGSQCMLLPFRECGECQPEGGG